MDHPRFALGLGNLAAFYATDGRTKEALRLQRRALSIRESALGPEHPDVAASLTVLGQTLRSAGKATEAEPLLGRAVAIREKVLGPSHPDVARSLSALAAIYADRNQMKKPEQLLRRSLSILEDTLPASHPETMECRAQLATVVAAKSSESFNRRHHDDVVTKVRAHCLRARRPDGPRPSFASSYLRATAAAAEVQESIKIYSPSFVFGERVAEGQRSHATAGATAVAAKAG